MYHYYLVYFWDLREPEDKQLCIAVYTYYKHNANPLDNKR